VFQDQITGTLSCWHRLLQAMATVNVDEVKVALPAKGELSKAAASGDLEGVMVLLQRGADPNEATDAKETPLHLATNPSVASL